LCHSTTPRATIDGFTLIEVLVALAVLATALPAIGALIASNARASHSITMRLTRLQAARTIMTALPDRNQLAPGSLSGSTVGQSWRVDVSPFTTNDITSQRQGRWVPQLVVITVRSATGAAMHINTIRLQKAE
jgi:prepilin-type N-terminal cleavage/methylation domain-containing protein